ncbi:hypothetical protein Ddye_028520 [Dipteronia dyeriana]|uniref:No apical meristem-associated C-terminal domain-containing protein n=1 Tax=Dipteronia dyeriana TaxID=168575 RepID=A0AAD9TDV1_9ROSI|nr:hypothetical protein Ddye_028520 [Dipteronia dyeriana]
MSSDDSGGSSSQRPIGVKKAKSKSKVEELNSTDFNTLKEGQEKLLEFYSRNAMHRERLNDILERKMRCLERKVECLEAEIVMTDLNTITDPMKREFMNRQQLKIMANKLDNKTMDLKIHLGLLGLLSNSVAQYIARHCINFDDWRSEWHGLGADYGEFGDLRGG